MRIFLACVLVGVGFLLAMWGIIYADALGLVNHTWAVEAAGRVAYVGGYTVRWPISVSG
jgi:hypothetical protein